MLCDCGENNKRLLAVNQHGSSAIFSHKYTKSHLILIEVWFCLSYSDSVDEGLIEAGGDLLNMQLRFL